MQNLGQFPDHGHGDLEDVGMNRKLTMFLTYAAYHRCKETEDGGSFHAPQMKQSLEALNMTSWSPCAHLSSSHRKGRKFGSSQGLAAWGTVRF